MRTYAVLYSYPTWNRYYGGLRGVRVQARSEAEAIAKIRRGVGGYGVCPDALIVRCKVVA